MTAARAGLPGGREGEQEDYAALRHSCGAMRVDRDVLVASGPEAESYLQGQLSQDVLAMAPGESRDALLLEPDGKLTALVRVTRLGDGGYVLDVDAGFGDAVEARLRRFRLRTKVDLAPAAWQCVALRGPLAAAATGAAPGDPLVVAFDWNGVTGVDLLGPVAGTAELPGARWCGPGAWEALRVEAGIPAMGLELDGRTIAAEADLVARTVSFTKGCYTGQELVARLDARGNRVARHLRGLVAAAAGSLAAGTELFDPASGKPVGRCTSAAWSPGLDRPVGLAYVHRSVTVPGEVAAGGADGERLAVRPLPLVAG